MGGGGGEKGYSREKSDSREGYLEREGRERGGARPEPTFQQGRGEAAPQEVHDVGPEGRRTGYEETDATTEPSPSLVEDNAVEDGVERPGGGDGGLRGGGRSASPGDSRGILAGTGPGPPGGGVQPTVGGPRGEAEEPEAVGHGSSKKRAGRRSSVIHGAQDLVVDTVEQAGDGMDGMDGLDGKRW